MPKYIVVAGGGRNLGKTTLCKQLCQILSGSVVVKIGHHEPKSGKSEHYYPIGTSYETIVDRFSNSAFVIIESGSILDESEFQADLVIFLPTENGPNKPGSERRKKAAHLVRGKPVGKDFATGLQRKLGLSDGEFKRVLLAVQVQLSS